MVLCHPVLSARSCKVCEAYMHHDSPGQPPATEPAKRGGRLLLRPSGKFAPCRYDATPCPKGTPEQSRMHNATNAAVWQHFQECDAVGVFPDDPIVRRNAATIRATLGRIERTRQETLAGLSMITGAR